MKATNSPAAISRVTCFQGQNLDFPQVIRLAQFRSSIRAIGDAASMYRVISAESSGKELLNPNGSIVAQGFDRIELAGAAGWVVAEEDPDRGREQECDHGGCGSRSTKGHFDVGRTTLITT